MVKRVEQVEAMRHPRICEESCTELLLEMQKTSWISKLYLLSESIPPSGST
jgi:hypothetical protein